MVSIHEEMVIAIEVMDEIEDVIIKFLPRVEIILYELTELIGMFNQELLYFEEMDESLLSIPLFTVIHYLLISLYICDRSGSFIYNLNGLFFIGSIWMWKLHRLKW
jgi:hypothetical protein